MSKRFLARSGSVSSASPHRATHPLDEVFELLPLLFEALLDLLAILGVAERLAGAILLGFELLGEAILVFVELLRPVAHLGQVVGELVRRLLAEVLADVVQLPAGAGPFGQGLRESALLERLGGLADVLAALLDLLPGLGHPFAVLLGLHPFLELVGVAEDLLLLVPEPLELPLDLLLRRVVLGRFEGRLQLLEPFVQVGLPLGELPEAVDDLPRLALFLLLLRELFRPGPALLLEAVLVVRELELIELPLRGGAARGRLPATSAGSCCGRPRTRGRGA